MRELIDRQTAIKAIISWQEHHIGAMRKCDVAEEIGTAPTVTRMPKLNFCPSCGADMRQPT